MDERVFKLKNLNILDTEEEEVFNEIVEAATEICHTPISTITLLDTNRQWFKAKIGIDINESPRAISICSHAVEESGQVMVITDLKADERFKDNPFVVENPKIRAYAGACLETNDGYRIGTVAVYDTKLRSFSERELFGLKTLARGTIRVIEEKMVKIDLLNQNKVLKSVIKHLESFNYMVAHDVKAPLRVMASFSDLLLKRKERLNLGEDEGRYLGFIQNAATNLSGMVSSLLNFSRYIQIENRSLTFIPTYTVISRIIQILNPEKDVIITIQKDLPYLFSVKLIFERVFQNVLSNAIKYRDTSKETSEVSITCTTSPEQYLFQIKDNGIGISEDRLKTVFELFNKDTKHEDSSGIGLCIVKELIQRINGTISIESKEGVGTTVWLTFPNA